jgi:hypothetical protein
MTKTLTPVQDACRSNAEVRNELYTVYAEVYLERESHLAACARLPGGHQEDECEWCERYEQRLIGVRLALRHFGGNPRTIPKQCRGTAEARAADCVIVPWPQPSHS